MHHAEKNKNVIYRLGRSVLEKYFVSVSKTSLGLRPFLRPRQNIFPVRTSHPVNSIYIFETKLKIRQNSTLQTSAITVTALKNSGCACAESNILKGAIIAYVTVLSPLFCHLLFTWAFNLIILTCFAPCVEIKYLKITSFAISAVVERQWILPGTAVNSKL